MFKVGDIVTFKLFSNNYAGYVLAIDVRYNTNDTWCNVLWFDNGTSNWTPQHALRKMED
jgi:hypothetical protein